LGAKSCTGAVAPGALDAVVVLAAPVGDRGVRRVGDAEEQLGLAARLELVEAHLAGLEVGRQGLQAIARLGELGRFLVELGHAIIRGIPLGPQTIELGLHRAALAIRLAPGRDERERRWDGGLTSEMRAGSIMAGFPASTIA
jgi:hypothetical protein